MTSPDNHKTPGITCWFKSEEEYDAKYGMKIKFEDYGIIQDANHTKVTTYNRSTRQTQKLRVSQLH